MPSDIVGAGVAAAGRRTVRKRMLQWRGREKGVGMRLFQTPPGRAPNLGFEPTVALTTAVPTLSLSDAAIIQPTAQLSQVGMLSVHPRLQLAPAAASLIAGADPKGVDLDVDRCWVQDAPSIWGKCLLKSDCSLTPFVDKFWSSIV